MISFFEVKFKFAADRNNLYIISQKNKGLGGARNTGISNAKGKYLLFLDSDDFYLNNSLIKLIDICKQVNTEVIEFGAQGMNENKQITFTKLFTNSQTYDGLTYYSSTNSMNSACNKAYLRDFLITNKLYFVEKLYIEDFEFNTRVLLLATSVCSINLLIACFLQNPESITRNRAHSQRIKLRNDIVKVMNHVFQLKNMFKDQDACEFINERLTYLNVSFFYQLFKDKCSIFEFRKERKRLKRLQLLYLNSKLKDTRKNYFRILLILLVKVKLI